MRLALILIVVIHLIIVFINIVAIPFLLIYTPWYISIPLISFLIRLATVERICPLTNIENWIRRKLGMKEIKTFIGHYIIKHIKRFISYVQSS